MALYRKYRPQSFSHLVGQDHIKDTLLNELKHNHPVHAYLFAGPRGTGKTSTARLIAKSLDCLDRSEEGEPCEKCEFCKDITEGSLIDVIEIDAASNRGIDEIRDLREKIVYAPTRAQNKIYIIDEVHMLTKEAFNALLKTLEEPPPNVYFVLCTTEIHKIPETIISRCQRFDFKRIDVKTIMTRLSYIAQKESLVVEDGVIELIAYYVQGGLRDAISLFEQMIFDGKLTIEHVKEHLSIAGHHTVSQLANALSEKDLSKALRLIQSIHGEGYDLATFQRELLDFLRQNLLKAVEQNNTSEIASLSSMIEILLQTREELRSSPIPQLPLELAAIKICAGANLVSETPPKLSSALPESAEEPETKKLEKLMEEPAAKEEETAAEIKQSLEELSWDLETVKRHWPRVIEKVSSPSVRRSLVTGMVTAIKDHEITIGFSARFHMEKANILENKVKTEDAFLKIFGKKPKIIFTIDANITPPRTQRAIVRNDGEESKPLKSTEESEDLSKQALEIFGGEEL